MRLFKEKGYDTRERVHNNFRWTFQEIAIGEMGIGVLSYLCYDELLWILPLQILMIPYMMVAKKEERKRIGDQYTQGFRELLQSLMTSLQAGYSVGNAFRAALVELRELYGGSGQPIVRELEYIVNGLSLHQKVDELFMDFAIRSENDDIYEFATILQIACNSGGNMVEILKNSVEHLQVKLETSEEINVMMSGKSFEKNIMLLMPFFILLYMRLTNGNYIAALYHNFTGGLVMTGMIGAVIGCFFWSEKIMRIEC